MKFAIVILVFCAWRLYDFSKHVDTLYIIISFVDGVK